MHRLPRTLSVGLLTLVLALTLTSGRADAATTLRTLPLEIGPKAVQRERVADVTPNYNLLQVPDYSDVPADSLFAHEIAWLGSVGITTGYPDGAFHPLANVERGAMAAFLYRLAGSPAYSEPDTSAFSDVNPGDMFYKEINWLAAQRISTGWPDGTFRPLEPVARDAMAAFLYRLVGSPAFTPPAVSPFVDVAPGTQFYAEMTWLASAGVTTGWPDGTFRPLENVKRDAMAAFLYRVGGFFPERNYSGTGAGTVTLPLLGARYWTAAITYETENPDSRFTVWTVDSDGRRIGPIVGLVGPYHGTVGVNSYQRGLAGDVAGLEVVADDAWTIKLRAVEQEETAPDGLYLGQWDRVLRVGDLAGKQVDFTYDGEGVFIVVVATRAGTILEVPIEEVGPWSGSYTLPANAYAIEVIVDGAWSMTT